MTAFSCYLDVFPSRCLDILDAYSTQAKAMDREVSLLLAVASVAIIIPYEHLRLHGRTKQPHSSGDCDRPEYANAKLQFEAMLDGSFLASRIWSADTPDTWQYGAVDPQSLNGEPDSWMPRDGSSRVDGSLTCCKLLSTIRNALAHGNIWMTPKANPGEQIQIERIVFASESQDGKTAHFATAAPSDVRKLLRSWVEFLKAANVPAGFVSDSDRFALAAE